MGSEGGGMDCRNSLGRARGRCLPLRSGLVATRRTGVCA